MPPTRTQRPERTESARAVQSVRPDISAARVKTKVWLEVDGRFVIGDGGLHLLDGIARHGSLAGAVREIRWSYRHAWGYLRRAQHAIGAPLIVVRPGRGAARGASLTPTGQSVLDQLRELRARIDHAVGPSGPTAAEIAARGRGRPARPPTGTRITGGC